MKLGIVGLPHIILIIQNKIFIKNPDIPKPPDHLRRFIILTMHSTSFLSS